jgi:hypothetical protein
MDGQEWVERWRTGTIARATRVWARWIDKVRPLIWIGAVVVGLATLRLACWVFDVGVVGQTLSVGALVIVGMGFGFWLGEREGLELAQRVCDAARALWSRLARRPIIPELTGKAKADDQLVTGRVMTLDGDSLSAPLSQRPCVAFGLRGRAGHQVVDDGDMVSFLVVTDEGEEVLIGAPQAELSLATAKPGRISRDDADRARAFLRSRGIDVSAGPLRLAENCLCQGDQVRVRGVLTDRPDPRDEARSFRYVPRTRAFLDVAEHPLIIERRS